MQDSGKPMVDAAFGELMVTCEKATWIARSGEAALRPEHREPGIMVRILSTLSGAQHPSVQRKALPSPLLLPCTRSVVLLNRFCSSCDMVWAVSFLHGLLRRLAKVYVSKRKFLCPHPSGTVTVPSSGSAYYVLPAVALHSIA